MSESGGLGPGEIVDLWRERFGQPPPIITDSETMLRIMRAWPPRSFAPPADPQVEVEMRIERPGREHFLRQAARGFDDLPPVGGEETTP
jgi:hypothetical protein